MQTDPIGYADGMNIYAYVGNDPVNFVDPTGLEACLDDKGAEIICVTAPTCGGGQVLVETSIGYACIDPKYINPTQPNGPSFTPTDSGDGGAAHSKPKKDDFIKDLTQCLSDELEGGIESTEFDRIILSALTLGLVNGAQTVKAENNRFQKRGITPPNSARNFVRGAAARGFLAGVLARALLDFSFSTSDAHHASEVCSRSDKAMRP